MNYTRLINSIFKSFIWKLVFGLVVGVFIFALSTDLMNASKNISALPLISKLTDENIVNLDLDAYPSMIFDEELESSETLPFDEYANSQLLNLLQDNVTLDKSFGMYLYTFKSTTHQNVNIEHPAVQYAISQGKLDENQLQKAIDEGFPILEEYGEIIENVVFATGKPEEVISSWDEDYTVIYLFGQAHHYTNLKPESANHPIIYLSNNMDVFDLGYVQRSYDSNKIEYLPDDFIDLNILGQGGQANKFIYIIDDLNPDLDDLRYYSGIDYLKYLDLIAVNPEEDILTDLDTILWEEYGSILRVESLDVEEQITQIIKGVLSLLYNLILVVLILALLIFYANKLVNQDINAFKAYRQFGSTRKEVYWSLYCYLSSYFVIPLLVFLTIHIFDSKLNLSPMGGSLYTFVAVYVVVTITISIVFALIKEKYIENQFTLSGGE